METVEIEHTLEGTDTHVELGIYIDRCFCGDFVMPKDEVENFIEGMRTGFGDKLIYSEK